MEKKKKRRILVSINFERPRSSSLCVDGMIRLTACRPRERFKQKRGKRKVQRCVLASLHARVCVRVRLCNC